LFLRFTFARVSHGATFSRRTKIILFSPISRLRNDNTMLHTVNTVRYSFQTTFPRKNISFREQRKSKKTSPLSYVLWRKQFYTLRNIMCANVLRARFWTSECEDRSSIFFFRYSSWEQIKNFSQPNC